MATKIGPRPLKSPLYPSFIIVELITLRTWASFLFAVDYIRTLMVSRGWPKTSPKIFAIFPENKFTSINFASLVGSAIIKF